MPFDLDITESLIFKMGEAAAAARVLTRVIERRFGPLPEEIRQRITTASTEQIDQWINRVLDAHTLDDIFADGPE